jgi:rod shape-determining protein MreC
MKITSKSLPFTLNKRIRPVFIFFSGLLIIILLIQVPVFSKARESVQFGANKVGTSFGNVWQRVFQSGESIQAQKNYYQNLAAELAVTSAQNTERDNRLIELETLLGYKESTSTKTTSARIIARSPDGKNSILIDKGSVDGLENNMPVIAEGGHMIGSILLAKDRTSIVRLLSDQSSSVPAAILGSSKTIGLVEGRDGFLLHMQFIPQDEDIQVNDVVISSGLDAYTPADLVIGIVAEVITNETAPFKEALIEPLLDLRSISQILVVSGIEEL